MLLKFQQMWDGLLSRIEASKQRIKLTSAGESSIHSAPYQAGPHAREFEKLGIDKMWTVDVIEPAQAKLAASIVLVHKKDKKSNFVCVTARSMQ